MRVRPLPLAPPRVRLALLQVRLPAHVVDLQQTAVGVQVEDLADDRVKQRGVVADHDEPAAERPQVVAEPADRIRVQVVGRLIKQQRPGPREQDPGQFDAAPLAAGEGVQRLGQDPVGQAQAGCDRGGLGLGRVAAQHHQPLLQLAVPAHRRVAPGRLPVRHLRLGRPHAGPHLVETAGGEHPVHGQAVHVAGPGVLRQVADGRAAAHHRARRGQHLARQHPGEGRLPGAVPADEADLVTWPDLEGRILQQQVRPRTQLHARCRDHWKPLQSRREGMSGAVPAPRRNRTSRAEWQHLVRIPARPRRLRGIIGRRLRRR